MRKELFEFRHVSKYIGGHEACRNLSVRLYQNEITFLIGRSSSARSVVTRLIMGEFTPEEGEMTLHGRPYQPLSQEGAHKQGIFCISQDTKLLQNLSMSENIYIAKPLSWGWKRHSADAFARMVCQEFDVPLDLEQKSSNAQLIDILMVYFLRALLMRAQILILDNLLYMLSDKELELLFQKLQILKERGVGILVVDPIWRYAIQYGDRTLFFSNGCISADFTKRAHSAEIAGALLSQEPPLLTVERKEMDAEPPQYTMLYPTENGIGEIPFAPGEVVRASCRNPEYYQGYLRFFSDMDWVRELNGRALSTRKAKIAVLTSQKLQTDHFLSMSFAENIALPAYPRLSSNGRLSAGAVKKFLKNEMADLLPVPYEQWGYHLSRFGDVEREQAVIYRMLMEDADILVIVGILDQPNMTIKEDIWKVIFRALECRKSVLLFHRDYTWPLQRQDRLIFLDDFGPPCQ